MNTCGPSWIVRGRSGVSGGVGASGISGYSGKSGFSGVSGFSGFSGVAPSSSPSALVSGAGSTDANGEYTPTGTHNGKPFFNLSGTSPGLSAISWTGSAWQILSAGAGVLYSSTENVASPWLVVTWTVDEDGTGPAPVVASSATNAVVSGAGTPEANGVYRYTGFSNGFPFYNLSGTDPAAFAITNEGGGSFIWHIYAAASSSLYENEAGAAFPWLDAGWGVGGGDSPAPTVSEG